MARHTGSVEGYRPATYGDGFADVYDEWYADLPDPDACARQITRLTAEAGGADRPGPVLELGVGTGRIARALTRRGATVVGIDASAAMLDRLVADPDPAVLAVRGDMADLPLASGSIPVVLAAFNTLFNLTTEAAQLRCLGEVARVLRPGGAFTVEAIVAPDAPERIEDVSIKHLGIDQVILTASVLDPGAQTITGQHVQFTESGTRLRPWLLRFLTLDQLDAATAAVGLVLASRWSDWDGTPFDDTARSHVSTYRKATST